MRGLTGMVFFSATFSLTLSFLACVSLLNQTAPEMPPPSLPPALLDSSSSSSSVAPAQCKDDPDWCDAAPPRLIPTARAHSSVCFPLFGRTTPALPSGLPETEAGHCLSLALPSRLMREASES
jgi:hypothetical protein